MANSEPVSGNEANQNPNKAGTFRPNPTRYNGTNTGINPHGNNGESDEEGANFDTENNPPEIDPGQLDREEIDLDRTGPDNSPSKSDPDTKTRRANAEGERGLSQAAKKQSVKKSRANLLGQGGYGTSGTSGTNSGGKQGYQSGLGTAGSQNGSTGYNAGSQGIDQTKGP